MAAIVAATKPKASKPITTKHLAYTLADQHQLTKKQGQQMLEYDKLILAVGSKPALPGLFDLGNKRVMTSTEALEIAFETFEMK